MYINLTYRKFSLFIAGIYFICCSHIFLCEEDVEGQIFHIFHSIESSDNVPVYKPRGFVTYYSSKNEAVYTDNESMTNEDMEKLKKLSESDGFYRVKLLTNPNNAEEEALFSFTKACGIYESGLTDNINIALDQGGLPVGIAISAVPSSCLGTVVPSFKSPGFNTTVMIVSLGNGPSPDTLTYIQRLEQEKAEKARGEQGDNRSFFAKYWMYIVPFVLFVLISGASNPEGQGGGR